MHVSNEKDGISVNRGEKAVLIGLSVAILLSFTGFAKTCEEIEDNVLRLHILANSDSEEDQRVKLAVRDRLLEDVPELFQEAEDRESAVEAARCTIDKIRDVVADELAVQGADYGFDVEIAENMYFEVREYDGFTMPAGFYSALRITLGRAEGKNWWCVMYPPLCSSAAVKTEEAFDRGQNGVLTANSDYEIKFKFCEILYRAGDTIKKWFD